MHGRPARRRARCGRDSSVRSRDDEGDRLAMPTDRIVDCHAHIIDPVRFPLTGPRGYKPRADEGGTREQFCAVLADHGVAHAVLDPGASDRTLDDLAAAGVVGVRFNLVSYEPDALSRRDAPLLLQRLKSLGWFAQVYADDEQWPLAAAVLRASGIRVLVDHFGVRDIGRGVHDKGFQSVLALGREGNTTMKLSSLFRVSKMLEGFEDLDPFVGEILSAFGVDRCIWGSDWPFINVPRRPSYADLMTPLSRWFPDPGDRARVLARNPSRLFGFGD